MAPVQKERLRVLVGDQREGHAADGADRRVPRGRADNRILLPGVGSAQRGLGLFCLFDSIWGITIMTEM